MASRRVYRVEHTLCRICLYPRRKSVVEIFSSLIPRATGDSKSCVISGHSTRHSECWKTLPEKGCKEERSRMRENQQITFESFLEIASSILHHYKRFYESTAIVVKDWETKGKISNATNILAQFWSSFQSKTFNNNRFFFIITKRWVNKKLSVPLE